jgi:hypothetical protein
MTDRAGTLAVAIFAKTPGLTPAKTRLAAGAGAATAEAFYLRALDLTEAVVCAAAATDAAFAPYWAVAERKGIGRDCWAGFPQIWQGEGDLGARLSHVYDGLLARHGAVLLIGADSPLLSPRLLARAREILVNEDREFVMGRALDGGFYLFGGQAPMAQGMWTSVTYSAADTADRLLTQVQPLGSVGQLPPLPDVDTLDDLLAIPAQAAALTELLPSQRALVQWINGLPRS